MKQQILIVDDEREVADLLELFLQNEGYRVHKFYDSAQALVYVETSNIDLAVLDIMMPGMDGFALCRKIREKYFFPVIMLTAKVEDTDKIAGLMQGADDYITKPFNPLEVVARIKSQLRRYTRYNPKASEDIDIRGLYMNRGTHECRLYQKPLELTPTEFDILWYLCEDTAKQIPGKRSRTAKE